MRFALGALLIGMGAALGFGRQLVQGGVRAAPTWVLVLTPFEVDRWVNLPPPATSTLLDQIAEELHLRDQAGQVGGMEGRVLAWRVDGQIRRTGDHQHQLELPNHARAIAAARFDGGVESATVGSMAEAMSAATGLVVRVSENSLVDPTWRVPLVGGPRPLAEAPVSLPAWPMRLDQALDLACGRSRFEVQWRATADGAIIESVPPRPLRRLVDSRALRTDLTADDSPTTRFITPSEGMARALAAGSVRSVIFARQQAAAVAGGTSINPIYYSSTYTDGGLSMTGARDLVGRTAWRRLVSRSVAAAMLDADFLYHVSGFQGFGNASGGVGDHVLLELPLSELRRADRLFAAIRRGPAPAGADRDQYLRTLARFDAPIRFARGSVDDLPALLGAIGGATGLRIVCDPVITAGQGFYERILLPRGGGVLTWRRNTLTRWVAGTEAVLLTDTLTATLLREPRMYRVRVPVGTRSTAKGDLSVSEAHELITTLCEAVDVDRPAWCVQSAAGTIEFVVYTRPDEHAAMSWLVEQVGRCLETGAHSPLSAVEGSPVGVYNLAALLAAAGDSGPASRLSDPIPEVAAVLMVIRDLTDARGLRGAAQSHRAGPVLIVRSTVEAHERVRAAIEAMNARLGEDDAAPLTPPGEPAGTAEPAGRVPQPPRP